MFLREMREPRTLLADRLPWVAIIAPGLVYQKDGLFQKTFAFRGPDMGSSSPAEKLYAHQQLNNTLLRLGSGWSVFVESRRLRANPYQQARWEHDASWVVDLERSQAFERRAHFESHYYITFVWLPPRPGALSQGQRLADAFFYTESQGGRKDAAAERPQMRRDIDRFLKTVDGVARQLQLIFAEVRELNDGETLTYLHGSTSTRRQTVGVPETPMYIDRILGHETLVQGDPLRLGDSFVRTCTLTDCPPALYPGILDSLNYLQCEYRFTTRWIALDKSDAHQIVHDYQSSWMNLQKGVREHVKEYRTKKESSRLDVGAQNNAASLNEALASLAADREGFGYYTGCVTVWDASRPAVAEKMANVRKVIEAGHFTVWEESTNALQAWLGTLPGHVFANVRRPILSTRNLVRLLPTSAPWAGRRENEHLGRVSGVGLPHIVCMTSGATPFNLNLNVGDVGHTLILGPTGAGKSTLLNLLALQWPKYEGGRVIIFDKDRSARAATLAMGGVILEPGSDAAPLSFQPLRHVERGAARIWASEFVLSLFAAQSVTDTLRLKEAIAAALDQLAGMPVALRTISTLSRILKSFDPEYALALQPYCGDGTYAQIFDGADDQIDSTHWLMIEMGHLMDMGEQVLVPALLFLLHRIEREFTGAPTLVNLDEVWRFLLNPTFAAVLHSWIKTLRKKNVFLVFATQEAADVVSHPLLKSTILSACSTTIFLADPKAADPAMAEHYGSGPNGSGLGLSPTEIALLAGMTQKRDYYYRSVEGRRVFSLELGPAQLALAAMSGSHQQKVIDTIVATRPTEIVEALLEHGGVDWAVRALRDARSQRGDDVAAA